ncbi:MAG TPA: ABC transporter permease subunit [Bacteroidales bacterium]|nr:ABC transporter permease subunit [Bacteroidales bacterium]
MLFKRELRRNVKSFIVSCLICSLMVVYVISIAPSFGEDIQQIIDLKFPKPLQKAFGISELDFSNPVGFFGLMFSYIYLFFSIYTAGVFSSIVSKEFTEKTAEYLFSLPANRIQIMISKLLVAIIYALLTIIILYGLTIISFTIFIGDNYNQTPLFLMALSWLIGGITFGSIAFLVSSFFSKQRTISAISVGMVMVMYMFQVIISMNKKLENLKYISPFDWFKGSDIANSGTISGTYILIAITISISCLIVGIIRFNKKDVLV